jgi:hypothetical protein
MGGLKLYREFLALRGAELRRFENELVSERGRNGENQQH